ncbi:hypothetical protein [Paenibacillus sp. FSL K6-2859]
MTGHWAASEIIEAAQSEIVNGYVNEGVEAANRC